MKRMIVFAGILALALTAGAEKVESLVNNEAPARFFFRPELAVTDLGDSTSELAGLQVGVSVDRALYIGVGGRALVNSIDAGPAFKDVGAGDFWYAGLTVEYTFLSEKLVHGSIGALVGGGKLDVEGEAGGAKENANLFVAEGGPNLLFNLTQSTELGLGVGYRYVNGSDFAGLESSDLSGVQGLVFLRWTED